MTAIKICGVKDLATYDLLAELQVNWVGLVFYPASPRFLSLSQAAQLPDYRNEGLLRVGLFVKPELEDIQRVIEKIHLDILQVYCPDEQAEFIRETFKIPVWIAKGIKTHQDLLRSCTVDGMVMEAPSYQSDTRPGGNGRQFDWSLTKTWKSVKPWLLAGGLTPDNIQEAIRISGAKAVDVSSGVEFKKGVKDLKLIRRFVMNARS